MAGNLYVREFATMSRDAHNNTVTVGSEPAVRDQVLAFSGTSVSVTLHDQTCFVELHADDVCHYVFGPTATASNMRLPGDATVFKGLKGKSRTLSAIEGV